MAASKPYNIPSLINFVQKSGVSPHFIFHIDRGIEHISILDSYFVRLKERKYEVKIVCDKKFTKKEDILKNRHVSYRESELQ
ncbi:hypothetical protein HB904_18160 [Listeria booriae]|uniref:Uncharacterized protein n=1 Tax=Listeria booriae TaxID=1552123 RepID=A0A842ANP6_9LIST|nr:hypothetical protein [Listeria booriae]